METQEIIAEACKLEWSARYEIAQTILQTLEPADNEIDPRWTAELQRRLDEHRSGRVPGIPAEEVLGHLG